MTSAVGKTVFKRQCTRMLQQPRIATKTTTAAPLHFISKNPMEIPDSPLEAIQIPNTTSTATSLNNAGPSQNTNQNNNDVPVPSNRETNASSFDVGSLHVLSERNGINDENIHTYLQTSPKNDESG